LLHGVGATKWDFAGQCEQMSAEDKGRFELGRVGFWVSRESAGTKG